MPTRLVRSRLLRLENFAPAVQWLMSDLPMAAGLRYDLHGVIEKLLSVEAIKGILIEEIAADGSVARLSGLGLSVFIPAALMDDYIDRPRAFVFTDILERARSSEPSALDIGAIGRKNAGGGLDLVVNYMQRGWDMREAIWREVGTIAHQTYVEHHRGYQIRRVLQEDWTANAEIYLAGGYRELGTVPADPAMLMPSKMPSPTRTLFLATEQDYDARMPGSTVSYLFQRREPRCFFTLAEQRVISHAREWATDQEIADRLGLSLTTVKHTWQSIYQRVAAGVPHIIGPDDDEGRRGPEKRRRVLAFLDDHPEELRPYVKGRR